MAVLGLVVGGVIGLLTGFQFGPFFSRVIYGPISVDENIRIDLVMWWAIGTGYGASLGALFGGHYGRCCAKRS